MTYYNEMQYEPKSNSMTFRLDYARNSDLDDTVGKWHVVPIAMPDGSTHSRVRERANEEHCPKSAAHLIRVRLTALLSLCSLQVSYSAALTLRMWLPKAVIDMLFSSTLGQATSWVAPEAKKRFAAASGGGKAKPAGAKSCRNTWRGRRCSGPSGPPPPPPPPAPSTLRTVMDWAVAAMAVIVVGGTLRAMVG